jgi:ADP-ribose pyrophosphatase
MTEGYTVLGTRQSVSNRVFTVVTDELRMPDGSVAERDYLRHVGAVAAVALDDAGQVVLVYQYRHPVRRELWELPAGLIDVEGEPLVDAAARELAEEVDLRAGRWDLLIDLHPTPGSSNEVIRVFLARDLTPVPEAELHERTHEEAGLTVHRFPLDEAVAMALRGEITNASCVAGVLATAFARDRNWSTLRPVDEPLPR